MRKLTIFSENTVKRLIQKNLKPISSNKILTIINIGQLAENFLSKIKILVLKNFQKMNFWNGSKLNASKYYQEDKKNQSKKLGIKATLFGNNIVPNKTSQISLLLNNNSNKTMLVPSLCKITRKLNLLLSVKQMKRKKRKNRKIKLKIISSKSPNLSSFFRETTISRKNKYWSNHKLMTPLIEMKISKSLEMISTPLPLSLMFTLMTPMSYK